MAFTERSRASREAILAAARTEFARHGFDRATVRAVAAEAGTDPALVIRYFGSKDGLFSAAVDVDLRLPDLTAVAPDERGRVLVDRLLVLWEGPDTGPVLTLLLRAATTHEIAAARVYEVFGGQVVAMLTTLRPGDPADAARRAGLIATQVLGFALTRYVLRLPPVVALGADDVRDALAPALQGILDAPRPAAG